MYCNGLDFLKLSLIGWYGSLAASYPVLCCNKVLCCLNLRYWYYFSQCIALNSLSVMIKRCNQNPLSVRYSNKMPKEAALVLSLSRIQRSKKTPNPGSRSALTCYLLLGAMRPVLHVEGSRSRPGIIVVRRSRPCCPFLFHFGFPPVVCLKTVSILHLLVSL